MLPETAKSRVWAIASALLTAVAALALGTGLTLAVVLWLRQRGIHLETTPTLLLMVGLNQGVAFWGVGLVHMVRRSPREEATRIGLRRLGSGDLPAAIRACVWALAGSTLAGVMAPALGVEPAENQLVQFGRDDPALFLIMMPVAMVLIGPGEELLFRGLVQRRLRDDFPSWPAIWIASLIFAGVHIFSLSGAWPERLVTVAVLMLPSLAFGVAYERRKNLWVPALAHGLYDVVLLGFAYVASQVELPDGLAWLLFAP